MKNLENALKIKIFATVIQVVSRNATIEETVVLPSVALGSEVHAVPF